MLAFSPTSHALTVAYITLSFLCLASLASAYQSSDGPAYQASQVDFSVTQSEVDIGRICELQR